MLIRDTARLLAHHAWVERRLYEVVGAWAADTGDGGVARVLAAWSHHHAWHASLFEDGLPVLHDLDPRELDPPAALVALVDAVAASADDLERLVALARVLGPELLGRYQAVLDVTSAVTDAPLARALRLTVTDEQEDWRAALVLLRSHLRTEDDLVRAAAHQSRVERLLLP